MINLELKIEQISKKKEISDGKIKKTQEQIVELQKSYETKLQALRKDLAKYKRQSKNFQKDIDGYANLIQAQSIVNKANNHDLSMNDIDNMIDSIDENQS